MTKRTNRYVGVEVTVAEIERWLNPDEVTQLHRDAETWRKLGTGAHLDEMLSMGASLLRLKQLVVRRVNTDRGRHYNMAFSNVAKHHFPDLPMDWITAIIWLVDPADPVRMETLNAIREAMTPGERARLNAPNTAQQRVRYKLREADEAQAAEAGVPVEKKEKKASLTQQQQKEIARLEEENARLKRQAEGGSLFDLRHDSAVTIATTIVGNVTPSKAKLIATAITAALKKRQTPGG
jgi:hypothetical protein